MTEDRGLVRISLLLFVALLPALIACAPMVKDGQPLAAQSDIVLRARQTLGQTFTARDRGLNGIEVFLAPEASSAGMLRLHLRASSQSADDITIATLDASTVTRAGFYRFTFAPQADSRGRDYYLQLELSDGAVRVGSASGEMYLDGALYRDGVPLDAQMTFRLAYDPIELALGLLAMLLTWLQVIGVAVLLFIVPGWALLTWLLPNWHALSFGERLGLASGVSIALYPLLILWTAVFDLHLGALYAWVPMLAAVGALVWRTKSNNWQLRIVNCQLSIESFAFAFVVVLVIFTRFWVIRSLDFPMWGDSYQHTMIAQLLVDNGGLFDAWLPYAELQTFTYHFGFHSAVAAFHWVTGASMPRAILWVGQILNILAVLALYPLAVRIGGNRWAGVGAVFVAGLLAPMPMFYTNWGRYTQLAGQVILPAAILLAWSVLEGHARDRRLLVLAWLVWGGLALTHYRVLIFSICFFPAYFLFHVRREQIVEAVRQIAWLGVGGGFLFLPWFIHTFAGKITANLARQLSTSPDAISAWTQQYNSIGDLASYLPMGLWLVFVLALAWGLWRRERALAVFALWWFFVLLAANPRWLRLPGEGALSNFAVFIAAYIVVGVVLGTAAGELANRFQIADLRLQIARKRGAVLALALLMVIGLWGARERALEVRAEPHALMTRADVRAMEWVRNNTPRDARFLVNTFFAYGGSVVVGSDGGWWLPFGARRQTNLPPINYGSEQGVRADYREWINALPRMIQEKGIGDASVIAEMRARGIRYVYIGQRQGRVNYAGPHVLKPSELLADARFRLVYRQDRVWVLEVLK